jgi:hypothetical protein
MNSPDYSNGSSQYFARWSNGIYKLPDAIIDRGFILLWIGLNYFGKLERYELYIYTGVVWVIEIIWSHIGYVISGLDRWNGYGAVLLTGKNSHLKKIILQQIHLEFLALAHDLYCLAYKITPSEKLSVSYIYGMRQSPQYYLLI